MGRQQPMPFICRARRGQSTCVRKRLWLSHKRGAQSGVEILFASRLAQACPREGQQRNAACCWVGKTSNGGGTWRALSAAVHCPLLLQHAPSPVPAGLEALPSLPLPFLPFPSPLLSPSLPALPPPPFFFPAPVTPFRFPSPPSPALVCFSLLLHCPKSLKP